MYDDQLSKSVFYKVPQTFSKNIRYKIRQTLKNWKCYSKKKWDMLIVVDEYLCGYTLFQFNVYTLNLILYTQSLCNSEMWDPVINMRVHIF